MATTPHEPTAHDNSNVIPLHPKQTVNSTQVHEGPAAGTEQPGPLINPVGQVIDNYAELVEAVMLRLFGPSFKTEDGGIEIIWTRPAEAGGTWRLHVILEPTGGFTMMVVWPDRRSRNVVRLRKFDVAVFLRFVDTGSLVGMKSD